MRSESSSLRVAFVVPFGLAPKGTASVRALPLARALAARGHQVTLLVPPWNDRSRSGQVWEEPGVRVVHLRLPGRAAWDVPVLTASLGRHIMAIAPHVLHAFKPKAYSGLMAAAWWWAGRFLSSTRVVVDADDWEGAGGWNEVEPYPLWLKRFFAWQERYGLTHAHGVTVASRALETVVWSLGVTPARVRYVPNGPGLLPTIKPNPGEIAARRRALGVAERPVVVLYTRFFEFDLGRAVCVWERVVRACPEARLLVVGRGLHGEDRQFEAEVRRRGLSETIVAVGWVLPSELPALLSAADVAFYPMDDTLINRTKCPVKLADLLALGLPVVGEAVGQVTEYLAHGAGVLVPPGDVDRSATALLDLLHDRERARRVGRAGQERLTRVFAWPVQGERVEAFYQELLAHPT